MDIVIVGCGKVGNALAQTLDNDHSVTVIEKDEARISSIINDTDVMGIVGNCLQTSVLDEANISKTNIFIAVTDSDETNILSCLIAKKMHARHCIARVRSPEFDKQLVFMREELGITDFTPEFMGKYVFDSKRERELVYVNRTTYNGPVRPSSEELDGGRFWTIQEIHEAIGKGVLTPNFEMEFQQFFG